MKLVKVGTNKLQPEKLVVPAIVEYGFISSLYQE